MAGTVFDKVEHYSPTETTETHIETQTIQYIVRLLLYKHFFILHLIMSYPQCQLMILNCNY